MLKIQENITNTTSMCKKKPKKTSNNVWWEK